MPAKNLLIVAVILFLADVAAVVAADVSRGETVRNRVRPDYDSAGAPLGSFSIYPKMELEFIYDDNIRALDEPELDDFIILASPSIEVRSDWSLHDLFLGARAKGASYRDYSNEDWTDSEVWGGGRLDFSRGYLDARLTHSNLHEPRVSPNDEAGIFPTQFTLDDLRVNFRYAPNRLFVALALRLADVTFKDTQNLPPPLGDGGATDNRDRDRVASDYSARIGYRTSPDYSIFFEARGFEVDYDTTVDRWGVNRDEVGYDVVVGGELNVSGVTFGDFFFGYRNIDYEDPQFKAQDGPVVGAAIDWNVTQLTTINFLVRQDLLGTTYEGASGIQALDARFRVDHELRRNILLNFAFDFRKEEFLQTRRTDNIGGVELGMSYLMNRHWQLNVGFQNQERDTNASFSSGARQFKINQLFFGFSAQA